MRQISVNMPDKIAEKIIAMAEFEGRPASDLCAFAIEVWMRENNPDWNKTA
jgi:hypothetical protein